MLSSAARLKILVRMKAVVLKHHFNIGNIDLAEWCRAVDEKAPSSINVEDDKMFETGVQELLSSLKSSHTDFYFSDRNPTRPEHAIGATLRAITCDGVQEWMFLDVFEDSPAARAGLTPGHRLVSVDSIQAAPPELPSFQFGREHELLVLVPNAPHPRVVRVTVPQRKATRPRLPLVEPKNVSYRMLTRSVGLLKIAYMSGAFGLDFARELDSAIDSLKKQGCDRLILDLRGCLGGGLGFARLVSYMCPGSIPIGYDVTRKRQRQGYDAAQLPRVRMPNTRLGVLSRLVQFSFRDKSLVLLTQGLGKQPFHGHMAVLINEFTSSAGEMAAQFAKETGLAPLIGGKTAGMVLGSEMFDLGEGYTLYLPIFGWYGPKGSYAEGSGIVPDVFVDIDPTLLAEGIDAQINAAVDILEKDQSAGS